MKKTLSIISMLCRHSLLWVFTILLGLAAANTIVFCLAIGPVLTNLPGMLDRFSLLAVFFAAFVLLTLSLCLSLCDRGGYQNYFLNRLCVSPKVVYLNQVLYNTICYGLLFAVEAISLLGLCFYAQHRFPEAFNHQSIMLACYQSDVLHTFFPLSDILGWAANITILLSLGVCTAALPTRNRSRKQSITTYFMSAAALFYIYMQSENGALYPDFKVLAIVISVLFLIISACGTLSLEVDNNA